MVFMSFFKDVADKLLQKKEELEAEARKRAREKATEIAIEQGKEAARSAVSGASKAIEDALFGDNDSDVSDDTAKADAPPGKSTSQSTGRPGAPSRHERTTEDLAREERAAAARRAEDRARLEAEVDDELAALKKKLKK
jgi:SRSO17 transposase